MKCQICKREKLVFYCVTIGGSHIISCITCAVACGLKIIEEVKLEKEVKGGETGVEGEGQAKGLS